MQSLSQGGGDRVAVLLANGFAEAGIPVQLVLMRDEGDGQAELKSLLHEEVSIVVGGSPLRLPLARILERLRGIRFIRERIRVFQPAIVLAATDNMALVTALSCRRGADGPQFALKLTNRLFRPTIGPFRRVYRYNLFKFIFRRAALILTLSAEEREDVIQKYPETAAVVRSVSNPYVTGQMLAAPARRSSGALSMLSAGRMVPQKRFDLLLRAFALSGHTDSTLTILGDGPLRSELTELAAELGVQERVHMPGFVADIVPWLTQSDLFVLSSDYEGLPAAIIEALACAVPVVTTNCFLAAQALLGGSALCRVVRAGDAEALALAISDAPFPTSSEREDLKNISHPYRIDTAVSAHIETLASAIKS